MPYLNAVSKNDRMISVYFHCKPFNITNPSLFPNQQCWRSWSWKAQWRPTKPSRTNTPKDVLFIIGNWNAKIGRQIWLWSTDWSREKANRVFPREFTGHGKHPLPTTQEKTVYMNITRWSKPKSDWLYSLQLKMEKLYTVSRNKTGSWLCLRSWAPYCQTQT